MDLVFSEDSARNTTLSLPTGEPVYLISTPSRVFHDEQTTITKFLPHGGGPVAIGRNVLPNGGIFKSGMSFTSSNGEEYTWKRKSDSALLSNKWNTHVAVYEAKHTGILGESPQSAKLSVMPEVTEILDEIVATFVYTERAYRV
ncbi:hypothetical protein V5O48_010848 [Marasmius crinis-equi]|uniref:DUF6593 domain-containing protein n=1 Tax=Marasmius crinis-equi TaxID=585013 RepID=A0ABR3F7Q1_9AGAR